MVFSSTIFLFIYLPIALMLYYITPFKWRNLVLLIENLVFYGWGEPVYVFLMLASVAVDYFLALMIERSHNKGKKWLIISVIINIGLLVLFKYLTFICDTLNALFSLNIALKMNIVMPIGISFYTFQKMSYVIDVYRNDCKAQHSFTAFGTYVSLFPQLIAGRSLNIVMLPSRWKHETHRLTSFPTAYVCLLSVFAKRYYLQTVLVFFGIHYITAETCPFSVHGLPLPLSPSRFTSTFPDIRTWQSA